MDVLGKQLELLVEAVPKVTALREAGRSLGVQLQLLEARTPHDFERAFTAMAKERASALLVMTDALFIGHSTRIASLAAKHRLPLLGYRDLVEIGGLMSYGPSIADLANRAATYVDKILKGARPADLPVEQPTKLELVINLKTARTLGFTIPRGLLLRADEVIE
jgi:putative ABC transport system substrate-binding protein